MMETHQVQLIEIVFITIHDKKNNNLKILHPPISGHIYNHFLSQLSRLLDCTEV